MHPEVIFRLLFNDKLLNLIVDCTNKNAEIQREQYQQTTFRSSQRTWKPINQSDILAYLGIIIYIVTENVLF